MEIKADRYNKGKLKWSLIDFDCLEPLVEVLEFGANKYSANNWKKGLDKDEILESAFRHLKDLMKNKKLDDESRLKHTGHIMANIMFYEYFDRLSEKDTPGINNKVFKVLIPNNWCKEKEINEGK